MRTIDPGHRYELANMENPDQPGQEIQFIKKGRKEKESQPVFELETIEDGTTNEEVLMVLIDRLKELNCTLPSEYNYEAIKHLEKALSILLLRSFFRKQVGIKGTSAL